MTKQRISILKVYWNDSDRYDKEDLPEELAEKLDSISRCTLASLTNISKVLQNTNIYYLEDYLTEITDLNQLLIKTKNIEYDFVLMISLGTLIHEPEEVSQGLQTLIDDNPDLTIAGHLMHVGLWKKHRPEFNNLFTMHHQTCVLSKTAIDEMRRQNFVFNNNLEYETDAWYPVDRSDENIHDDYTPLWISKSTTDNNPVPMYKNHEFGFGEDLIQFAVKQNWKIINLNEDIRGGKRFSYFVENPNQLLDLLNIKELNDLNEKENDISESHYKFVRNLVKCQDESFFAYNNETMIEDVPDLNYDCFIGPAPGYMPWKYLLHYNFAPNTKVFLIDINKHAVNFQYWFFNNFDPDLDLDWEGWVEKFRDNYDQYLLERLDDHKYIDACNEEWKKLYPAIKEKWKYIKNYQINFINNSAVNENLLSQCLKNCNQPLVWNSNIFNYKLSWAQPDIINNYHDYVNNLITSNINTQWCGNTPWGFQDVSFYDLENLSIPYYKQKHIPKFNSEQFLKEIENLEQNNLFTAHRSSTGRGWESFVIHGLGYDKTKHYDSYGFSSNEDAPYHYTPEAKQYTPTIVKYFQDNLDSFHENCYHRVRIMKLSPGGIIGVHNDNDERDDVWALNVAINNPKDCKMHFWDRQMRYLGIVPWEPSSAFEIRIGMNHMVLNKSNQTRYHMIIHGD